MEKSTCVCVRVCLCVSVFVYFTYFILHLLILHAFIFYAIRHGTQDLCSECEIDEVDSTD